MLHFLGCLGLKEHHGVLVGFFLLVFTRVQLLLELEWVNEALGFLLVAAGYSFGNSTTNSLTNSFGHFLSCCPLRFVIGGC